MNAEPISWLHLSFGYLLILIPYLILTYYKTGLIKATFISVGRMTIQLLLVGVYLEFLFKLNNTFVNIVWVLTMIIISAFTITKRAKLNWKLFILPLSLAIFASILIVEPVFLGIVINLKNFFDAKYMIPLVGMMLGNTLSNNVIALSTYFSQLKREQIMYRFALANGATRNEALLPFIKETLNKSINPVLATMTVTGLISLPGIMTGQILGGSDPMDAIKYQIMIMISIFTVSTLSVFLSVYLSNRFIFDDYSNLKTI